MSKILMRQYAFCPRKKEWIREIRGERLQEIAEGTSSALRLVSSLAASFPGKNECPGTHCSLIIQEEKEDSLCRVARTESERRRREIADLSVLPKPAKSLQNNAVFSGKT